jgi:CMP-N-acetylneuraminic acid synthetase
MSIIITILARIHSKGLPEKCLKMLDGKPLYRHTLDQALAWGKGYIAVFTDSPTIIRTLPKDSVAWIKQPDSLRQDNTSRIEAIRYCVQFLENKTSMVYDAVIDLDVTNPLRKPNDIEKAFRLFRKRKKSVLFSVTSARRNPYVNQVELGQHGEICTPKQIGEPYSIQEAPNVYDLNRSIYIFDRNWLIKNGNISATSEDSCGYLMQDWQAFNVGKQVDWEIMEAMYYKYMGVTRKIPFLRKRKA